MPSVQPPRWSREELEADRLKALTAFVSAFGAEGTKAYEQRVQELIGPLNQLFSARNDIANLSAETFTQHPGLLRVARFLAAPPISAYDLRTLIGGNVGVNRPNAERAASAARILNLALDPVRYPWLAEKRTASLAERDSAIHWTASICAIESMRTYRRNVSAREQEAKVRERLADAGFTESGRRAITLIEQLEPGAFSRECRLGDRNCDVPVRLADGRLLAIECKVSNTAINSKKRLNNDVGAKAAAWHDLFGTQVITVAVLSGVYSPGDLMRAQEQQRITIFWSHDLEPLVQFAISSARPT